jgi:hypothetical protein
MYLESLSDLDADQYTLQAQLFVYERYNRAEGRSVILPTSCVNPSGGNGAYDPPVGTLYSTTHHIAFTNDFYTSIEIDQVVEPTKSPGCAGYGRENSEYVKTFRN